MPTLIYDIMRVMLALTGPAAFICLVNAGIALRKEGGTVFWVGGGFSRWMLWTVIFLALEPTLVWFQFLGFPVFFPPGAAIGNSWLSGITTGLTTFVNDFVVARLAPVLAAFFVIRAVLDTASGTGPLPSLLSAMFLLAISSTHALIDAWTPVGNRFSIVIGLESMWNYLASRIFPLAAGLAICGAIIQFAFNRPGYTDRLNDIFGEWGWTRTYSVQVAQNFERTLNKGGNGQKQSVICAKVVVVSTVSVSGLGSHTGVGEEWADDENSATRAEAQAFKRACTCFGLGRYLYDLDKIWEDLDQYNRPVRSPNLPDWALPAHARRQKPPQSRPHSVGPTQPRQGLVQQETLAKVKQLCETVGFGLSKFTLQKYGGVADASKSGIEQ